MRFCRIAWTNTTDGCVGYGNWLPIDQEKAVKEWLEVLRTTHPHIIHEFEVMEADNQKDSTQKPKSK